MKYEIIREEYGVSGRALKNGCKVLHEVKSIKSVRELLTMLKVENFNNLGRIVNEKEMSFDVEYLIAVDGKATGKYQKRYHYFVEHKW